MNFIRIICQIIILTDVNKNNETRCVDDSGRMLRKEYIPRWLIYIYLIYEKSRIFSLEAGNSSMRFIPRDPWPGQ